MAPHVSIVKDKTAVNIYNASGASAFTCTFNEDGTLVPPTPVYSGWKIENAWNKTIEGVEKGFASGTNGALLREITGATITETSIINKYGYSSAIYDQNSKYAVALSEVAEGQILVYIYDKTNNKTYKHIANVIDLSNGNLASVEVIVPSEAKSTFDEYIKQSITTYTLDTDSSLITDIHLYVPTVNELLEVKNNTTFENTYINNGGDATIWGYLKYQQQYYIDILNDPSGEYYSTFVMLMGTFVYKYNGVERRTGLMF